MEKSGIFHNTNPGDIFPMLENNLDSIMKKEALSNADLARLSGLAEKTISKVRRELTNPAPGTKNKIVRGLNDHLKKLKNYIETDVFPFLN